MNLEYDSKLIQQYAFRWLLSFGSGLVTSKQLNDAYASSAAHNTLRLLDAGYIEQIYTGYSTEYRFTPEGLEHLKCL